MCITEYNEKVFLDGIRSESKAEGIAEGMTKGEIKGENNALERLAKNLMTDKNLSYEEALNEAKIWLR